MRLLYETTTKLYSLRFICLLLLVVVVVDIEGAAARNSRGSSSKVATATRKRQKNYKSPPSNSSNRRIIAANKYEAVKVGQLLALNSGFVNGCCLGGGILKGHNQAVAAVTGAHTTAALSLAKKNSNNLPFFFSQLCILLAYSGGSALYGILQPNPQLFEWDASLGYGFFLAAGLLAMSSFLANNSNSSSSIAHSHYYYCYAMLATMACGLHNGMTSVHSGNLVRSAHMSGMTSDVGSFVGQALRGNKQNMEKLRIFLRLVLCFFLGAVLSVFATSTSFFGSHSLLLAAGLDSLLGVLFFVCLYA